MINKKELKLIAFSVVFLLFIAGCAGGDKTPAGAPTSPFLGGSEGIEISFLEGAPPEEVTDNGLFDFQAILMIKNKGEYALGKDQVNASLIGFQPEDFGITDDAATVAVDERDVLEGRRPDDDPQPRKRDSEGNIIEAVETLITFPTDTANFNVRRSLPGNNVFVFRADVCYRYETQAASDICVLENMIDVPSDALCQPSEPKEVFSSGSPVTITSFRQNAVGKDKVQFVFDIVHSGQGSIFSRENPFSQCPKTPTQRRQKEDVVNVTVKTGLPDVDGDAATGVSLNCVGLRDSTAASVSIGSVKLINGKRTITCTQSLNPSRSDFVRKIDINATFNYLQNLDKEILVKHVIE